MYTLIYLLANFLPLLGPQKVNSRVSLSLGSDLSTKSKGGKAASVNTTLIQVSDINLDASVVLCCDQLVSP